MSIFHVYTDGACSGNPGPGGWAYVILDEQGRLLHEMSGYAPNTTNNRMEIQAALSGIKQASLLGDNPNIILYSDSNYLIQAFTKGWMANWLKTGWKKNTVKNQDLWQELNVLLNKVKVEWIKVKGHSDNEYNNRCDQMAVAAIKQHVHNSNSESEITHDHTTSVDVSIEGVVLPDFEPSELNNPFANKASQNRCLVSKSDLAGNISKIKQVAERFPFENVKQLLDPVTASSIQSSVTQATFAHSSRPVHPYFLQVGNMADFWLSRNASRTSPYPSPSRSDLIKFICGFIEKTGVDKARQLGL